jgi:hypothetical protein
MNATMHAAQFDNPRTTLIDGVLGAMSLPELITAAKHLDKVACLIANHDCSTNPAGDVLTKFESAICAYRPRNMAEVAMKARYALDTNLDDTDDRFPYFLQSLIDAAEEVP